MSRDISSSWAISNHLPEALESARKASDLDAELLKQNPSSPALQMNLAMDLMAIGSAYSDMGKYAPAIDYQRQSITLREQVAAANPAGRRAADRLGYAVYMLAVAEQRQGDKAATRRDFRRAVDIYDGLKKKTPLSSQSLLNFARSSYWVGRYETETGNRSEGCRSFWLALSLAEEYNLKEPAQPETNTVEEDRVAVRSCSR